MARNDGNTFGQALRKHRQKKSFTLADIACLSGFSVVYLSQIERGTRKPRDPVVCKILRVYGIFDREGKRLRILAARQRGRVNICAIVLFLEGITVEQFLDSGFAKLEINRNRSWPKVAPDQPCEHDRSKDKPGA